MGIEQKKLAVLSVLQQQSGPLSLSGLLGVLGHGYSERTVRRWLSSMVTEGLIKKTGEKRSTRYYSIKNPLSSQFEVKSEAIFSEKSISIIQHVHRPLFIRNPVAYQQEWFNQYQPNITTYISPAIQQQLFQAGERSKNYEPAGTYAHHIFNRLLIDLSYNSARLEGNTYSLLDTKRLLIEGMGADDKLDEEKIMILNHKEAIRYLVDNADKIKTNETEICTLQFLLGEGLIPNQYAGKVRDHGMRISGSTYIPFENPSQLTHQLSRICHKTADIQNPYERSFFLLVHIAYLQAFVDINKRTARLSANIPLIQNNLVPLSFNDVEKDDYASAMLAIYEFNEVSPLLELYVYSYLRTCQLYDVTVEAAGFDEVRVRYRRWRREILRFVIENQLTGKTMEDYIHSHVPSSVAASHRADFVTGIKEDLTLITPQRIGGLSVTLQQLEAWLKKIQSAAALVPEKNAVHCQVIHDIF